MIIIRHNKLAPPYDDYSRLDIREMDMLATHKVSPDIQTIENKVIYEKFSGIITGHQQIYCSPSARAVQTCSRILDVLMVKTGYKTDDNLKEIFFSPLELLNDSSQNPLEAIRQDLYNWVIEGRDGVESYRSLKSRLDAVLDLYGDKDCICFSHGFFIRLLVAYKHSRGDLKQALQRAASVAPVNYLEIIKI